MPSPAIAANLGQYGLPENYANDFQYVECVVALTARQVVVISYGAALGFRANTTTTASHGRVFGVVDKDAAIATQAQIITKGLTFVNVGANTPADLDLCVTSTTAGVAGVVSPDATVPVGSVIGVYLAGKDANNLAPVFVNKM